MITTLLKKILIVKYLPKLLEGSTFYVTVIFNIVQLFIDNA